MNGAATGDLQRVLEQRAELVADRELERRRGLLASLAPEEREAIGAVAHGLAARLAGYLVAQARRDELIARTWTGRVEPDTGSAASASDPSDSRSGGLPRGARSGGA